MFNTTDHFVTSRDSEAVNQLMYEKMSQKWEIKEDTDLFNTNVNRVFQLTSLMLKIK